MPRPTRGRPTKPGARCVPALQIEIVSLASSAWSSPLVNRYAIYRSTVGQSERRVDAEVRLRCVAFGVEHVKRVGLPDGQPQLGNVNRARFLRVAPTEVDDQLFIDEDPHVVIAHEREFFGALVYKRRVNFGGEAKIVVGAPSRQILRLIAEPSVVEREVRGIRQIVAVVDRSGKCGRAVAEGRELQGHNIGHIHAGRVIVPLVEVRRSRCARGVRGNGGGVNWLTIGTECAFDDAFDILSGRCLEVRMATGCGAHQ